MLFVVKFKKITLGAKYVQIMYATHRLRLFYPLVFHLHAL